MLDLFLGVPLDVWDAFWFGTTGTGQRRRDAFIQIYQLEIATIEEGEPPVPVEVVRPIDFVYWVEVAVFILTPAAACLAGCEQSKLPWES